MLPLKKSFKHNYTTHSISSCFPPFTCAYSFFVASDTDFFAAGFFFLGAFFCGKSLWDVLGVVSVLTTKHASG